MSNVTFLKANSPQAILAEVERVKPDAFIVVYLNDGHATIAGEWKSGRVTAMGMLADAMHCLGSQERQ